MATERLVRLTIRVPLLPDSGLRATADRVDVFRYRSSEHDGWVFEEWRLKAAGLSVGARLEGWYSEANAPESVIGRVRIKRCAGDGHADLDQLAPLAGDATAGGIAEILNVELEPLFLGQGLGKMLVRAALAAVPADGIVVCEPTPTEFSNVAPEKSATAVDSFYRRLGFDADDRLPGYLIARRGDLDM